MADQQTASLSLQGMTLMPATDAAFRGVLLDTSAGSIETRFYQAPGAKAAILWLGDAYGGFDSPAEGLYDRLAERFQAMGISSLRMQYRNPTDEAQTGLDALVGAFLLNNQGYERVVVVGHGQGSLGAVQAGLRFPFVTGVALLAPRDVAADGIEGLSPTPLLVQHGTEDPVIPASVARALHDRAGDPKQIYYYQKAGHKLDEAADAVSEDLSDWLKQQLGLNRS